MGIFDGNMPYTNLHELNLDWVIKKLKELENKVSEIPTEPNLNQLKVFVTPEMFGAKGDGETDDTIAIQNAINEATENQYELIFEARKNYVVSRTIFIKPKNSGGLTIDFQESEITPVSGGNFTNGYVFALNSENCTSAITPIPRYTTILKNGKFINRNQIEDLHFMFVGGQILVENCLFRFYYGCFIYPQAEPNYIDLAIFRNCHFMDNMGSLSSIQKYGSGDNVLLENIKTIAYESQYNSNYNLLSLRTSRGCVLQGVTNGNIYLNNSQNVSINNCHFENYNLHTVASQFVVNNTYFWLRDVCNILIEDGSASQVSKPVVFNDCQFVQKWEKFNVADVPSIDISNYIGYLELNRVYSTINHETVTEGRMSQTSILINTANGLIQNNSPETKFIYGKLQPVKLSTPEDYNSSAQLNNVTTVDDSTGNFDDSYVGGRVYYRTITFLDKDRFIANGFYANALNQNLISNTQSMRLRFLNEMLPVRIYRSKDNANWTEYVDIDLVVGRSVHDRGNSVNGISWKENPSGTLQYPSRLFKSVSPINENGNIIAFGELREGQTPNSWVQGNWKTGDIIVNTNQTYSQTIGMWICTNGANKTFKYVTMN